MAEVTEIIIAAPTGRFDRGDSESDMLLAYMHAAFPGYTFLLDTLSPFAVEGDYGLIPVAGRVGGPDSCMFKPLARETLEAMYDALAAYSGGSIH